MTDINGYKAFYGGKSIEVRAETSYKAQLEAQCVLSVPDKKRHMIAVVLCERSDGSQVIHTAID